MKKNDSSKARFVLPICLAVGAVVLAVGGTLAIYTSQVYQRAVVRNRENDVIRFSSDKLYRVMDGTAAQKYYYPMGKDQYTMTFSVCNYDQVKNTLFSEKKIDYEITFAVTNGTDNFDYTVSCGTNSKTLKNKETCSMTGTLSGGQRSVDTYSVEFNDKDYNNVEIEVTVTPTELTTTQKRILNAVLIPIEYATTQGVRLSWDYTDKARDNPDQFDAYNLLVSVSGGEGNVLITWNHTKLDIDPFFASGKTVVENGDESTITVPMNSEDATGTYLISFYNHNTTKPTWTAWNELPISVTLEESKTDPTTP